MKKKYYAAIALVIITICSVLLLWGLNVIGNESPIEAAHTFPSAEEVSKTEDNSQEERYDLPEDRPEDKPDPKITEREVSETPEVVVTAEEEPRPLEGVVIGIDAGHQASGNSQQEAVAPGSNETKARVSSGTRGTTTGVYEYELNLAVALKLEEELVGLGANVAMLRRTNDVDISNQERATIMNSADVDLCIRIHANGSNDASVRGAMMLVPGSVYTAAIQAESLLAGEIIFESFLAATGAENDGVISRDDMTGFNWSEVPVCLIELGYMTNPEEDRLLATDEYRALCAKGLAEGILQWHVTLNG